MANGQIKINELPETTLVKDDDVFVLENGVVTQKLSLSRLINYIKEHPEISGYFVKETAIGTKNGIAPLDETCKIPASHLPFGTTENTVYDGALGKAASDSLALHLDSTANPHSVTKAQIGLSNVDNTSDMSKPVSTLQQTFIDAAYANSNAYTDQKIADLINGAPSTLDTLGEIAEAIKNNPGVSDALNEAIGSKADAAELDSHIQNDTIHITASERLSFENKLGKNDDASETTVSFSEVSELSPITPGEKLKTAMGKIAKSISTLISHLSTPASANVSGHVKLSDTYENAVEDGAAANGMGASQKALADAYSALNNNLGNCSFSVQSDGAYITYIPEGGADSVSKKLGSNGGLLAPIKSTVRLIWNGNISETKAILTSYFADSLDDARDCWVSFNGYGVTAASPRGFDENGQSVILYDKVLGQTPILISKFHWIQIFATIGSAASSDFSYTLTVTPAD